MKKMDDDKDGRVSYEDFELSVKGNPLMLEAFGTCLPTGKVTELCLLTIFVKPVKQRVEKQHLTPLPCLNYLLLFQTGEQFCNSVLEIKP